MPAHAIKAFFLAERGFFFLARVALALIRRFTFLLTISIQPILWNFIELCLTIPSFSAPFQAAPAFPASAR